MDAEINISMPAGARWFIVGFGTVWCCFWLFGAVLLLTTAWIASLVLAVVVAAGVCCAFRWTRLRVLTSGDELVVRNFFRTHRLARGAIEDLVLVKAGRFRIAPHALSVGWMFEIEAHVRNGKVIPLTVTRWPRLVPWPAAKYAKHLADLREWTHQDGGDAVRA